MSQLLRQVFLSETLIACDSNLESFFILLQNVSLETAFILLEQEFEGNGAGVGSMTDKLAKVRILELNSLKLDLNFPSLILFFSLSLKADFHLYCFVKSHHDLLVNDFTASG